MLLHPYVRYNDWTYLQHKFGFKSTITIEDAITQLVDHNRESSRPIHQSDRSIRKEGIPDNLSAI